MKTVLVFSGYDGTSACGNLLDIRVLQKMDVHGFGLISELTAQNSYQVFGCFPIPKEMIRLQYQSMMAEFQIDGVKIGMVRSQEHWDWILETFGEGQKSLVWDPVICSSSGFSFLGEEKRDNLVSTIQKCTTVLTPNIPEAAFFLKKSEEEVRTKRENALEELGRLFPEQSILLKGGHIDHVKEDLLLTKGKIIPFRREAIITKRDRGTGCMLSTMIAGNLAKGYGVAESVEIAKEAVWKAMKDGYILSEGRGFLNV